MLTPYNRKQTNKSTIATSNPRYTLTTACSGTTSCVVYGPISTSTPLQHPYFPIRRPYLFIHADHMHFGGEDRPPQDVASILEVYWINPCIPGWQWSRSKTRSLHRSQCALDFSNCRAALRKKTSIPHMYHLQVWKRRWRSVTCHES